MLDATMWAVRAPADDPAATTVVRSAGSGAPAGGPAAESPEGRIDERAGVRHDDRPAPGRIDPDGVCA
ncbi:hypothetical protein Ae505Ps2_1120c [Pseudonocardia sp. Ae505_Ps2]|nr:hypothetical protein Ae505Ps2_1120c [Pseudonocardia sp. Ae505_Ps2]